MSTAFANAQSNTGTCTLTAPASPQVTWNLTALTVSMAGPTAGPNAKLTIYDGAVGGTVLAAYFLTGPTTIVTGSVGSTQTIPIPKNAQGLDGLQSLPGNAMNIQVTGTGQNQVSINGRFTDGLP